MRDKLTPMEAEMKFNLPEVSRPRHIRSALDPVIDQNRGTIKHDTINIQKNCGSDNICIPDLRLKIDSNDNFIMGTKQIVFDVEINNYGEDAFESSFYMPIPSGFTFNRAEKIGSKEETSLGCSVPNLKDPILKCDVGNPLTRNQHPRFKVVLLPHIGAQLVPQYSFYFEVNSTNAERNETKDNNIVRKNIVVTLETSLTVKGVAIDEEILYNASEYKTLKNATREQDLGPQVVHLYEIRNGGPSGITEAEVYFVWPYKSMSGEHLLYLLNQPETSRNVQCEKSEFANVLTHQIQLDSSLERTSYLSLRGAIEKSTTQIGKEDSQGTVQGQSTVQANPSVQGQSTVQGQSVGATVHRTPEQERQIEQQQNQLPTGDSSMHYQQRTNANSQMQGGTSQGTVTYAGNQNNGSAAGGHYQGSQFQVTQQQQGGAGGAAGVHRAGFGVPPRTHTLDDVPTEGNVNQDISGLESRTQSVGPGKRRMMSQQDGEAPRPDLISGASVYDRVGAGKQGFQAGSVELNTLNRNNVDNELQHGGSIYQSGASSGTQYGGGRQQSSGNSGSYQGNLGGQQGGGSYGFHQQASYGSGNAELPQNNYEYTQDYHNENGDHPQQGISTQQFSHSYRGPGISNPNTVPIDRQFRHYPRAKRDARDLSDEELKRKLQCNRSECKVIRCVVSSLNSGSEAWIAFRMRLVSETMQKVKKLIVSIPTLFYHLLLLAYNSRWLQMYR